MSELSRQVMRLRKERIECQCEQPEIVESECGCGRHPNCIECGGHLPAPYDTNPTLALALLAELEAEGWKCEIRGGFLVLTPPGGEMEFEPHNGFADPPSIAAAICRAYRRVKGGGA